MSKIFKIVVIIAIIVFSLIGCESSSKAVNPPIPTPSDSTTSMLECEAMTDASDTNGNKFTAYTMPDFPDPNALNGTDGHASICVAGYSYSNGTETVNVSSNLDSCKKVSVTMMGTGSVIPAYRVPDGDIYCIAQ